MEIKVYFRIEGEHFEPDKFANGPGSKLHGRVGKRAHDGTPLTRRPLNYWESRIVVADELTAEDALSELAKDLETTGIAHMGATVWAEMIVYYSGKELPSGFFFPRETLALLSKIGAQLEIVQQKSP